MASFLQNRIHVHCAFCRTPRRVYRKKRAQIQDYLGVALISGLAMFLIFGGADPRGLFFLGIGLILMEIGIQIRWRMSVTCSHCGFDPVLYLRDHEKAAQKVRLHLEKRRENPDLLLAHPLCLPTRRPAESARPLRGQNLSKQI